MATSAAVALSYEPELAPGVEGYAKETPTGYYIPILKARSPGTGQVRAYLDSLPVDRRVVFPAPSNQHLACMLLRRGFHPTVEWNETEGGMSAIYERSPEKLRLRVLLMADRYGNLYGQGLDVQHLEIGTFESIDQAFSLQSKPFQNPSPFTYWEFLMRGLSRYAITTRKPEVTTGFERIYYHEPELMPG